MTEDAGITPGAAPGELLAGRYRLQEVLGSGASAVVYAATDELLDIKVAIKLLHDSSDAERQIREASVAMSLHHPAIVRCDGAFNVDGQRFIIMERAAGRSLKERLEEGPLSIDESVTILRTIASALDYAHSKGVLHRDIAPGNIILDESVGSTLSAKLIDFGIAKQFDTLSENTQTVGIGTAVYAAPEQLRGKPAPQSDLYGLGAVAYHMLTGTPPVIGQQQQLPAELPVWLAELLQGCLEIDTSRRIQSAQAVIAKIDSGAAARGLGRRKVLSLRTRTRLRALLVTITVLPAAFATLLLVTPDVRGVVAGWCAQLEVVTPLRFPAGSILAAAARSAAADGNAAALREIFKPGRFPSEARAVLLNEALYAAVKQGHVDATAVLIDNGADILRADATVSCELLDSVIESGSVEVLDLLVSRELNLKRCFELFRPLHTAARHNDLKMFSNLLSRWTQYRPLPKGSVTPLLVALTSESPAAFIQQVVDAGPESVNARDFFGHSALLTSSAHFRQAQFARIIPIPTLDVKLLNPQGLSALHLLAIPDTDAPPNEGPARAAAAKQLLALGAELNLRDPQGTTPLMYAVNSQLSELVAVLLDQPSIEINLANNDGFSALWFAVSPQQRFNDEILKLLLSRGANPHQRDVNGVSALEQARLLGREGYFLPAHTAISEESTHE